MSVSGGLGEARAGATRAQRMRVNCARYLALLGRRPRPARRSLWLAPVRLAAGAVAVITVLVATMIIADARAVGLVQRMPEWLVEAFARATDLGKSVWVLVPTALGLAAIAALASPARLFSSPRRNWFRK